MKGKVILVGAGCGKADLITVRGLRAIRSAEVLVYDDLIDDELLAENPGAEKLYMGKRASRPSAKQSEIIALLTEKALQGKTVVRLKGGDPFLFGRGGEELYALKAAGIDCEVIPGISSALAIPAEAGIPVTERGLSRELHILTAHTETGIRQDFDSLAQLKGTLVFLMGLGAIREITEGLLRGGMDPHTPAAVISGGNAPLPSSRRGELCDIAEKARDMLAPAVIVIGAVAALGAE